ncbi:MAG: ATP-binding cassette domain-containing protein [Campylobacterales bacterium]
MLRVSSLTITHGSDCLVDLAFELKRSLALVGFSGSGKSLTLKALLGLLPPPLTAKLDIDAPFKLVPGKTVGFIPQNPFTALSPLSTLEKQFFAPRDEARMMMERVGLDGGLLKRYPSELSGGQLQRAILAMVLASRPKLLLLDEPTTALDEVNKQAVVQLLLQLQEELGFLVIFVTHEIHLASQLCERMVVIDKGRLVEEGEAQHILSSPTSEIAKRLIEAHFGRREFRR